MMKKFKEIVFLVFALAAFSAGAQDKPIRILASPNIESPAISIGSNHQVILTPPSGTEFDVQAIGMVRLSILTNKTSVFTTPADIDITVQIKGYDKLSAQIINIPRTLKVRHQPYSNAPYKDQDYVIFDSPNYPNIYKLITTVTGIAINGSTSYVQLPPNFRIETSIDYLRYSNFNYNYNSLAVTATSQDLDCNSIPETTLLNWLPAPGTTHYELEYCVINDYSYNSTPLNVSSYIDFANNSTRIVTKDNSYILPPVTDRGLIAIRYRCFGRIVPNPGSPTTLSPEIAGNWSPVLPLNTAQFEGGKNWQYNATFAEDGKQKIVINYADGSGRSRETITQNNSDRTTIVGQTIYDLTGRPAVTILPSPIPAPACTTAFAQNSYSYIANINVGTVGSGSFSKYHFDLDQSLGSCSTTNYGLANTKGAGKYFSQLNPDQTAQQGFVPDAGGFPYSQVEYTGDNTGRIKRQGGVGPEFQLNTGHETKYFYGAPEQIELDRLFGSEVGDASHYQKNMIIDPNGQVSISYIDMAGKTVATALSGNAPTNLENIYPQPAVSSLKADMFNKNAKGKSQNNLLNADGDAIEFSKSILVSSMNSANTFTYNIAVDTLKLSCTPNICFNCVYELDFKVTDDCGTLIYTTSPGLSKKLVGKFTVVGSDTVFDVTNCTSPSIFSYQEISPSLPLNPGVYYVTKTLRVSKKARDTYLKSYLDKTKNTCILDISDFEANELTKITDTLDCFVNCDSCFSKLGSKDNYVAKGKGTELEWQSLYENCQKLCQVSKTSCDIYLNQLLLDVSPNGQYGSWTNPSDPLSVYNFQNLLPKNVNVITVPGAAITSNQQAYWKKPMTSGGSPYYLDSYGQRDTIKITKVLQGSTSNLGYYNLAVDQLAHTYTLSPNHYYTFPEYLINVSDFVSRWKSSWAQSLVTYHPEYCYYQDCPNKFGKAAGTNTMTSNDYDALLLNTSTFAKAVSKGLIVPTGGGGYLLDYMIDDLAAQSGYYAPIYSAPTPLTDIYNTYNISMGPLNMHQYVAYIVKCSSQIGSNQTNVPTCISFCDVNDNTTSKDKQWNTLKGLYLAEKAKISANYSDQMRFDPSNASCSYYNGCIGKVDFDAYGSPMVQYAGSSIVPSSKYFSSDQPCNMVMKDLYATKIKRFGNVSNPSTLDESEADYQLYLQTGKCPNALDLQNLADQLAKNLKLNPLNINNVSVPEPLQNYPQLTLNLYNYFNNLPNPPSTYINYLWSATVLGSNDLKVDIKNSFTNVISKTITFHPPSSSSINWNQVSRITQLMYVSTVGSIYNFTCIAKEQQGTSYVYKIISGETDIQLTGCMFKDVCTSNDLAKQLQSLMSVLKTSPNLNNSNMFSAAAVQMGASGALNAYGNSLLKVQQTLGGSATSNLAWKSTGNCKFEISDLTNPAGCKIVINFLSITPGNLSPGVFNNVISFANIKCDYQNFFTMEARGANNLVVGVVKGEIFKSCNGNQQGLSMGACGKPDPAECKTQYHQNREDLEILLKDIILNQKYTTGNNNVMANPNLSNGLIANFTPMAANIPTIKQSVSNTYYRYLTQEFIPASPTVVNDSVFFTFQSPCTNKGPGGGNPSGKIVSGTSQETFGGKYSSAETDGSGNPPVDPNCLPITYCNIWFKTNYKTNPINSAYGLANIVNVQSLVGYGNTTGSGSYTDFYIVVNYAATAATAGKQPIDTLYGSSCFEIQNCNNCGAKQTQCCGGVTGNGNYSRVSADNSAVKTVQNQIAVAKGIAKIDSSAVMYSRYSEAVTNLNKRMNLNSGDKDFVSTLSINQLKISGYPDAEPYYLEYINRFDINSGNRNYLTSISTFINEYPFFSTKEFAQVRYKNAVQNYNWRVAVLGGNEINSDQDSKLYTFENNEQVTAYVNYLKSSSVSTTFTPVPISSFQNQSGKYSSTSTNSGGGLTHCDSLYNAYITARNYFIASHPNYTAPPLYAQSLFVQRNFCCDPAGYANFMQFISTYYVNNTYPDPLPTGPITCPPPNTDPCSVRFDNYVSALNLFNGSVFANNNSFFLSNQFNTGEEFANQGYCDCVLDYIKYLNNYQGSLPKGIRGPAVIREFTGCGKTSYCDDVYDKYVDAVNAYASAASHNPSLPMIPLVYVSSMFTQNGYCYCSDAYSSFLNGVVNGSITDPTYINDHIDIATFCTPVHLDCAQPSAIDTTESPAYPGTAEDPCAKYKKDLAKANAKLLYGQYVAAQSAMFISQYNARCLGVTENLLRDYDDKEFQYTLYYYDQAGNLIKTIPPAGIDQTFYSSIKKYTDVNAVKVKSDRNSKNKTVVVNHGLASNYVFNSLNQLIKQKVPDHDGISSIDFKYKYSLGVDTSVNILSSQVIDQNTGYLAGNDFLPASTFFPAGIFRGKVFVSHDACENWQRVGNISGSDLKKIQFVDVGTSVYGFAVGSDGTFMFSIDAGNNWDQFALPEASYNNTFNDIKVLYNNTDMDAVLVGEKGTCVRVHFSPSSAPITYTFNQLPSSGAFGSTENITDITGEVLTAGVFEFYITVLNTVDQSSKIYKRKSSDPNWTDITGTRVLDLNKVRFYKGSKDGYAAGKDGTLLKSTSNGANWYIQKTGVNGNIKDIYFSTSAIGVCIMEDNLGFGKLYKTIDGGTSWNLVDLSTTNNYKTLSPYYFATTLDRITANGLNGLVKRVTIDYSNPAIPAIGAITTNINTSAAVNDIALVHYNNNTQWFAIAACNSGEVFYSTDYDQSFVTWVLASNLGGNPKKIAANIQNPNGPTFTLESLVLKDGNSSTTALPTFLNSTAFTISNMNLPVTWSSGGLNTWASAYNLVYSDMTYDLFSTLSNPHSKVYLLGYDNVAATCSITSISLIALSGSSPATPYTNSANLNSNLKTLAVNYDQGCAMAVNTSGELVIASKSSQFTTPGPISYVSKTGAIIPSKINDIQVYSGNLIVMGDDGFCADKTVSLSNPFLLRESKSNLNYKAFDYYNKPTNSKMMVVCDKGVVCDVAGLGNLAVSNNYTVSTQNLNDFISGTIPNSSPPIIPGYFVGDNATVVYTELTPFINNSFNSLLPAVFTSVIMNTESHINSVGFDHTSGMAITAGDNTQSFNLGGASSLQNPNWFTNEITQLHFTDANNGYVVGKRGLIKHTSDGGANWQTVKPYTIPATNITPDFYSVYTTVQDTAIVGGTYSFLGNIKNKIVDPPIVLNTNANHIIHDIDLSNETSGFAVGTKYAPYAATASLISIANNLLVLSGLSDLTAGGIGNSGFKSMYAFKGPQAGKFIAVGVNATVKYYNSVNFNTTITWHPLVTSVPMFQNSDLINAITFADNTDGFIGGANAKLGSITIDHTTPQIDVTEKATAVTIGSNSSGLFVVNALSIVDDGGISAFMGGNFTNTNKYNWKFGQEKGKYSDLFWYDRLGRLVLSQNAKQSPSKYSYTRYDALGRIIEVGQKTENASGGKVFANIFGTFINNGFNNSAIDDANFATWLNDNSGSRTEITRTYYDVQIFDGTSACALPNGYVQENLRKRVASSVYQSVNGPICNYDHATHYSYDALGNVKVLIQDNVKMNSVPPYNNRYKYIYYDYDVISGKVNRLSYQPGKPDAFYHDYNYDADNRLTEVKTSRDGVVWESDAKYFYYKHGPLARAEYGNDKVQGIDYAYTVQGWLKGVNSNKLSPSNDIGGDGLTTGANNLFATDATGFTLGYFKTTNEDYTPIKSTVWASANRFESFIGSSTSPSNLFSARSNLFNGNISSMATSISRPDALYSGAPSVGYTIPAKPLANAYKYDQLNRLTKSNSFKNFRVANNDWLGTNTAIYMDTLNYDANGNIIRQVKADTTNSVFDNLTYFYDLDAQGRPKNNRLTNVTDTKSSSLMPNDIDAQIANNYGYDAIGNLIRDNSENIGTYGGSIDWNLYGKVKAVNRDPGNSRKNLLFDYDAQSNRVAKHIYSNTGAWEKSIFYVRDAQGNILAEYESYTVSSSNFFTLKERSIYGSARIGMDRQEVELVGYATSVPKPGARNVGNKHFELSNHLGNINAVISDIKIPVPSSGNTSIGYFVADIVNATDYYPFGEPMGGRNYDNSDYRYGFNGKEKDDEIKGNANSLDFGARIYDPRLGKTFCIDPNFKKYSFLSPYSMFNNNPNIFVDKDGRDYTYSVEIIKDKNGTAIGKVIHVDVQVKVLNLSKSAATSSDFSSTESKGHSVYDYMAASTVNDGKGNYKSLPTTVNVSTTFTMIKDVNEVKPGENLMLIVDKVSISKDGNWAGIAEFRGNISAVEGQYINKNGWTQLGLHELGHNLGLEDNYTDNFAGSGLMGSLTNGGEKTVTGNLELSTDEKKSTGMHQLSGSGKMVNGDVKNKVKGFVSGNTNANPEDSKLKKK